jgi:hypothetical protein
MSQIGITKSHPKAYPPKPFEVQAERLQFFVIHQIGFSVTHIRKIKNPALRKRICLFPLSLFPIAPSGSDFANIDFRIEVSGKGVTMIPRIAVKDVYLMDFIK